MEGSGSNFFSRTQSNISHTPYGFLNHCCIVSCKLILPEAFLLVLSRDSSVFISN
jgi:hypothetical protein